MSTAAMTSMCTDNCTNIGILYEFANDEIWARWNAIAYYFDYQPWIFSIIGSAMVGLSGVFPLLIIPIDAGADLKNGAGAGTLKILLSFAVGGLLGDVFLHLLPEAWASKALNTAQADGQRPMACGLWVLTGFLVFIIAEKIFIGEGEGNEEENDEDDDSENDNEESKSTDDTKNKKNEYFNNNVHKEFDNNNCLTLNGIIGGSKNHLSKLKYSKNAEENWDSTIIDKSGLNEMKNGYSIQAIATITRKNDFTKKATATNDISFVDDKRANGLSKTSNPAMGFVRAALNSENEKIRNLVGSAKKITRINEKTLTASNAAKPERKGKRITGYLNLMANCIDNFTHGLAVGGSFLVSFRLGALTTFAILIHEIPHEVGDFAILLKSGFNRWDAARAQLLTASGGIFGALVAVMCSGSGIESRTSWILPFTAGGFLHIGMVTVLPELLKETNPKESIKQLGALLSGIIVMAILTVLCD